MKLVDTDEEGPVAAQEPPVRPTPPRPEKRRVAVSLLFTVAVLVGTVVAVFTIFPERHNEIITSTVNAHRSPGTWDVAAPPAPALEVWARAVLGEPPPLPVASPTVIPVGARAMSILSRRAALIRYRVGPTDEVSYLVQRARDVPHRRVHRREGEQQVEAWRKGPWTCVAVGPAASAATWAPALGVP